jgi:hypothetical protein
MSGEWGKAKQYAAQLAAWDGRIAEIQGIQDPIKGERNQEEHLELICIFDPEPQGDIVGSFWIANLLTRIEVANLDERLDLQEPFELGFKIGRQTFLPNGQIVETKGDPIVLWTKHEQRE